MVPMGGIERTDTAIFQVACSTQLSYLVMPWAVVDGSRRPAFIVGSEGPVYHASLRLRRRGQDRRWRSVPA